MFNCFSSFLTVSIAFCTVCYCLFNCSLWFCSRDCIAFLLVFIASLIDLLVCMGLYSFRICFYGVFNCFPVCFKGLYGVCIGLYSLFHDFCSFLKAFVLPLYCFFLYSSFNCFSSAFKRFLLAFVLVFIVR